MIKKNMNYNPPDPHLTIKFLLATTNLNIDFSLRKSPVRHKDVSWSANLSR